MASARGGLMESPYFKDDTAQLLPIASDKKSDSGNFDSCLETLVKASTRCVRASSGGCFFVFTLRSPRDLRPLRHACVRQRSCCTSLPPCSWIVRSVSQL